MTNCGPGRMHDSRNSRRTTFGLQPKRSARPAQTPAMTFPCRGRVRVDATEGSFRATDLVALHRASAGCGAPASGQRPEVTPGFRVSTPDRRAGDAAAHTSDRRGAP